MAKGKIAVEGNLTNVVSDLRANGYQVVDIESGRLGDVEAVVVSGMDDNMMGIADIETRAPVINASGLTAAEVRDQVARSTKLVLKRI